MHLTLIRHAAAFASAPARISDFERTLSPAGEREVARMAVRLREAGFTPDRIAASSARRTTQTVDVIALQIRYPLERIERSDDLYLASGARLVDRVSRADDRTRHLALVGHNPGLTDLWDWLTDDRGQPLPTCGVVRFELAITRWLEIAPGCGRLIDFDHPARDPGADD